MSNFTRNDLKEWFRATHPSAQTPTQPSNEDGLLTESYGDMNDPYNPDADPNLVQRDMAGAQGDPPFFSGEFAQNTPSTRGHKADQAVARLEDMLGEEFANAMAVGVDLKQIAAAIESALDMATVSVSGKEADHKCEITPSPVQSYR